MKHRLTMPEEDARQMRKALMKIEALAIMEEMNCIACAQIRDISVRSLEYIIKRYPKPFRLKTNKKNRSTVTTAHE